MAEVVGVRFKEVGKIYYFDPDLKKLKKGDRVIVETARGIECGEVALENRDISEDEIMHPLKPIIRLACEDDIKIAEQNRKKEAEAFSVCEKKIEELGLDMKLVGVECTFDGSKMLFYFTADGRVDFRELVKDLAAVFKTRIELRQIGVRDETKILGGIGSCGRPLCCATFLPEFNPVSIKMAKEQNLSLNPTKISGVCGRLMCCLKNEQDTYEELNSHLPNVGDTVTTPEKLVGEVSSVNVLRQRVKVLVTLENDEKELKEYPVEELRFKRKRRFDKVRIDDDKELKALEELERKEGKAHISDD